MSDKDVVSCELQLHPPTELDSSADAVELRTSYLAAAQRKCTPVTFTEQVVVAEMARRAAQMHELDESLMALQRVAFESLTVAMPSGTNSVGNEMLATVVSAVRSESLLRQGLAASRGFYRALETFRTLRVEESKFGDPITSRCDTHFDAEAECAEYLRQRFECGLHACPRCGQAGGGCWLASRGCWQCGRCRTQAGLRNGTIMARSSVALKKWFAAIGLVLQQPTITTADLAARIGIRREPTVGAMAKKIRTALLMKDASQRLAGLDALYLGIS